MKRSSEILLKRVVFWGGSLYNIMWVIIILWSLWIPVISSFSLLQLEDYSNASGSSKEACIYRCAGQEAFSECMSSCNSSWIFSSIDLLSNCEAIAEDTSSRAACTPRPEDVEEFEFTKRLPSGKVMGFLHMKWKPCNIAIDDLRGYYFQLYDDTDETIRCYGAHLADNLTTAESDLNMELDFVAPLESGEFYYVLMQAFPFRDNSDFVKSYSTHSCRELNGPHSCFCGQDKPLPPIVEVNGYSLNVSFYPVKPCFGLSKYELKICTVTDPTCQTSPAMIIIPNDKNDQSLISSQFYNVYDSHEYSFGVRVVGLYDDPEASNLTRFKVKAWFPSKPRIMSMNNITGLVEIAFVVPSDYNITSFELRLITYSQESSIANMTSEIFKATKARHGIIIKQYVLDNGLYGVQVREDRKKSSYYNEAQWSLVQSFSVHRTQPSPQPGFTVIIVVTATVAAVLLLLFVFACYAVRMIPESWNTFRKLILPFMPHEPLPELRRLKILLIWQSDYRTHELRRLQENVIKCLVRFLASLGIELTVDLFEQEPLSEHYCTWIDKAIADADRIVFVCPHFQYAKDKQNLVGNFNRACRYLMNQGIESKFVTVVFPHANLDVSSDAVYLRRMSATFLLMDNIDGFYFHLQGLSKTNFIQTLAVEHMNGQDYVKLPEGKDLQKALQELKTELGRFKPDANGSNYISSGDDGSGGNACDSSTDALHCEGTSFHGNEINPLLTPESFHFPDSGSFCPPDNNCFPVQQRAKCEPIAPLVNDPEKAILELNGLSNPGAYQYACPIHNDPPDGDRITTCERHCRVFYSHESSLLHAHAFGEDCSVCEEVTNPKAPMEWQQQNSRNNSLSDQPESSDDSGIYPTCSDDPDKISIA